jgi:hypothetical protein
MAAKKKVSVGSYKRKATVAKHTRRKGVKGTRRLPKK